MNYKYKYRQNCYIGDGICTNYPDSKKIDGEISSIKQPDC
jgi:hypothetical protein